MKQISHRKRFSQSHNSFSVIFIVKCSFSRMRNFYWFSEYVFLLYLKKSIKHAIVASELLRLRHNERMTYFSMLFTFFPFLIFFLNHWLTDQKNVHIYSCVIQSAEQSLT